MYEKQLILWFENNHIMWLIEETMKLNDVVALTIKDCGSSGCCGSLYNGIMWLLEKLNSVVALTSTHVFSSISTATKNFIVRITTA